MKKLNFEDIDKALILATKFHNGQYRKDNVTPYIEHPKMVLNVWTIVFGELFSKVSDDYFMETYLTGAVVSLLHDTIEDTDLSSDEITSLFGQDVSDYVLDLTNPPNLTKETKTSFLKDKWPKLELIPKYVKYCDRIANLIDSASLSTSDREHLFIVSKSIFGKEILKDYEKVLKILQ